MDSADIIRLILQFLKLNGLVSSFDALKTETGVNLNVVHDKTAILHNISQAKWDLVLQDISLMDWSAIDLTPLFELMFLDFLKNGEFEAGRTILRESAPMKLLRDKQPDQYHRLEHALLSRSFTSNDVAVMDELKEKVIQFFKSNLAEAPKENRLLRLINESLKWQLHGINLPTNCRFDLFRGVMVADSEKMDQVPCNIFTQYNLKLTCMCFDSTGSLFCIGDADGFINLVDFITGQPHPDYQTADPMAMPKSITCCKFDAVNGTLLMVGTIDGSVAVWKVDHGTTKPIKYFPNVCAHPINSVDLSIDGNVVACSDHSMFILGLRSGNVLRHFADIHCARVVVSNGQIVALSTNKTIVTFDQNFAKRECLLSVQPHILNSHGPAVVVDGGLFKDHAYTLLCGDMTVIASTCNHNFIFLALSDCVKVFDHSGTFKETITVSNVTHIAVHPKLNVLVTSDGTTVSILKP